MIQPGLLDTKEVKSTNVVSDFKLSLSVFDYNYKQFFVDDNRMKHICQWPSHRDHFGESRPFYKRFSAIQALHKLVRIYAFINIFYICLANLYIYLLQTIAGNPGRIPL